MIAVRKLAVDLLVSREALEDAEGMRAYFEEEFRRMRLRALGFLGLVRCARCGRRTRCVSTLFRAGEAVELLGSTCARLRWAELVG